MDYFIFEYLVYRCNNQNLRINTGENNVWMCACIVTHYFSRDGWTVYMYGCTVPMGCTVGWSDIRFFPKLGLEAPRDRKIFWQQHVITEQMFHWIKTRESVAHQSCSFVELHRKLSFNYFFFFPWFFGRKYPIEDSTNC